VYGHASKAFNISEIGAPAYLCPANIPESLRTGLLEITQKAAQALNVDDVARVDFRLGADGNPYLIEINTLPGLNPYVSDLCIMAAAEGMLYQVLITEILYLAAERFSLPLRAADYWTDEDNACFVGKETWNYDLHTNSASKRLTRCL
ncbi:MAG: hypothetical protein WBF05_07335, partial [Anaerolineales bacterium]